MAEYGTSSDATYSVTLAGFDEIASILADNTGGSITARNIRDSFYTVWNDLTYLETGSFSYTSLTPSYVQVGGLTTGLTFSDVPLQSLFDQIFYPYQDVEYDLSVINPVPALFEYGNVPGGTGPNATLAVTITKKSNTIVSCTLSTPYDITPTVSPGIPTSGSTVSYFNVVVNPNALATYTLTLSDYNGTTGQSGRQITATVGWYMSRYYGYIDLSSISNNFDIRRASASQSVVLDSLISDRFGLTAAESLSSLNTSPTSLLGSSISIDSDAKHLVVAWPSSDWTYSVFPRTIYNGFQANMFKKVKSNYSIINVYGYGAVSYDIYMSFFPQGKTELTILNQEQ